MSVSFDVKAALYAKEIERKEGEDVLYVNFLPAPFVPSIASQAEIMGRVVDFLVEMPEVSRVIFVQQRNYHYPSDQILMLQELARITSYLLKNENVLSPSKLGMMGDVASMHAEVSYLITLLRQDPWNCHKELGKRLKNSRLELGRGDVTNRGGLLQYINFLEKFKGMLGKSRLIEVISRNSSAKIGRDAYEEVFRPDMLPNFTFTRLVAQLPPDAELIDQYQIEQDNETISVTILKRKNDAKFFYHIMPPEYTLGEDQYLLLHLARNVLIEHRPEANEFTDPERTRQVFYNVAKDLLSELSSSKGVVLNNRDLEKMALILVRHTIGFGLIEVLLMDEKLQDILLNAPIAQNPIFVRHGKYDECVTNIIPSYEDADSWAAKLRLQSGRPLDEANPVLDTDLEFGKIRARVAAVSQPLSPNGLTYALRRHREKPWTLPLFVKNKMINSFTAGLFSFLIDGSRTLLVAGTRSSGKTSLLGSLLLEIMPKYRIVTVEDTLELPVVALRKVGYDILRLKVRGALSSGSTEVEASEGIRTSLRLGDSALIVGEVRSGEAKALYEAMRIGALANVVAGTIHGDSPYGVFDRVVNDLGVPPTSFKATDLIIVTNPVKSPDGLHSLKRVVRVTEVRKHWNKDPDQESGFVDLLRYNVETDELEPTQELINGESEIIKSIAGQVKGWAGNWDAVYDNILLRGKIKQEVIALAEREGKPELLEAEFNSLSNAAFHSISDEVVQEDGLPWGEKVFPRWKEWAVKTAKDF